MKSAKNPVHTTKKTLQIIDALNGAETKGVSDIADELGFGVSLVHNHLQTLQEAGYVVQRGEKYELSYKFLEIGGKKRHDLDLFRHSKSEIDDLADSTGEVAQVMIEENGLGIDIYRSRGEKSINNDPYIGRRTHLHTSSAGKAHLAGFSEDRVDEIIDQYGLEPLTENTITDRDELFSELEVIRNRGYAIDDEERYKGLRCVGVPIHDHQGTVLGAISISGPARRLTDEELDETLIKEVLDTANLIELNLRM